MRSYSTLVRHPGNQSLFEAVELSVVAALAGWPLHLHAEGLRGTGKTTIIRAARDFMPKLTRIRGCSYNCEPSRPHCPQHRDLAREEIEALGTEQIPMPFLEISHSAKVGTVAGSIDLARLTDRSGPETALLPGVLARAHRGIVFIDEINRLADTSPEVTDLLLDAMGTRPGRLQIEETGLPTVELPVQVAVWAASNPDEDPGALEDVRRQLADRFDLNVNMGRVNSRDILLQILGEADPDWETSDSLTPHIAAARTTAASRCRFGDVLATRASAAAQVAIPAQVRRTIADLYLECGLESLRTVEAVQLAARVACAREGRREVSLADLRRVVPLVAGRRADPEAIQRFLARASQSETRPAAGSYAAHQPPPGGGADAPPIALPHSNQAGPGHDSAGGQRGADQRAGPTEAIAGLDDSSAADAPGAGSRPTIDPFPKNAGRDKTTGRARRPGLLSRLFSPLLAGDGVTPPTWPATGSTTAQWPDGATQPPGDPPRWPVQAPPERARQLHQLPSQDLIRVPDQGNRAGR